MARADVHVVEFVGGPLDGFRPAVSFARFEKESYLAIPINVNVIQAVAQQPTGEALPATSAAIYELTVDGINATAQRYDYVGPATVESFGLEHWTG